MEVIEITILGYLAGKTAFIIRFFDNEFRETICSIGIEKNQKILELPNGNKVKLILWDKAGNERFLTFSGTTLKTANGCILMYDITQKRSFETVFYWIEEIKQLDLNIPTIIIGNKCDLIDYRTITKEEGEELSKKNGFHYYESSNKECINIYEPIYDLVDQILKKREEIKRIENEKLNNAKKEKTKKNTKKEKKYDF